MRHIHADLIHAWAEGAEIERRDPTGKWFTVMDCDCITWDKGAEYRIKPTPKPDFHTYCYIDKDVGYNARTSDSNCKLTFDGETGELKSAEVL